MQNAKSVPSQLNDSKESHEDLIIANATEGPVTKNTTIRPTSSGGEMSNIKNGVTTILRGVSTFKLSEILRGSFMFTKNQQVRDVANSVIDTIFGERNETEPDNRQGMFPLTGL